MGDGTKLGQVRGLGSAKAGAHHWIVHRITAGSNLLLMVWLLASLARLPAYDYVTVSQWLGSAWAAVPMALLVVSVFYHFRLGLQTLAEDYWQDWQRFTLLVLITFFTVGAGGAALFAIVKIALAGGAAH